ncbi:granzyme H-like [Equus asinus]|uniref:granzyme H-like n=1 Tax=Equus asinus TaxID=9793 RepID=UPI0038F7DC34
MPGGLAGCAQVDKTFPSGEIIGGHEARPHSCPYMAFVQFLVEEKNHRCGGVLVRQDFVLTAAHCWGSSIKVTLGAHNIQKQERTQQVISVKKAIPHPDYNPKNLANDIMLLKLEREAKLTAAVRTLSLPWGTGQVRPGEMCHVAGWGRVTPNGIAPDTLQEVELTVQQDRTKAESHSALMGRGSGTWGRRRTRPLSEMKLGQRPGSGLGSGGAHQGLPCPLISHMEATQVAFTDRALGMHVGRTRGSMDSVLPTLCQQGDSGGPLVCENVIQGIVSYGQNNGKPPRAFTKVSSFLPWIKETMKNL